MLEIIDGSTSDSRNDGSAVKPKNSPNNISKVYTRFIVAKLDGVEHSDTVKKMVGQFLF